MVSPVNASRQPSRTAAHHSGSERLARPYSAADFHLLSFASLSWRSPSWVNNGLYRQPCHTSAYPPEADENDAKAEVAAAMSAVEGKADVVCQELSGPFVAKTGHSTCEPLEFTMPRIVHSRTAQWSKLISKKPSAVCRFFASLTSWSGHEGGLQ